MATFPDKRAMGIRGFVPAPVSNMSQTNGHRRKSSGPPPDPGEILDYLVWRQLGFEDQFGESFLDPEEEVQIPLPPQK